MISILQRKLKFFNLFNPWIGHCLHMNHRRCWICFQQLSLDETGWSLDSGIQGPCIRHGALEHPTALLWLVFFFFFSTGPRRCVHLDLEPPYLLDHMPGTWDPEFPTQWGSLSSWVCAEPLSQVHYSKVTPLIPGPDRFLQKKKKKKKNGQHGAKNSKGQKRRVDSSK